MKQETGHQNTIKKMYDSGMSLRQIAKKIGIGETTVRDWFHGRVKNPKIETEVIGVKLKNEKPPEPPTNFDLEEFLESLTPVTFSKTPRKNPIKITETSSRALVIGDIHFGSHCPKTLDIFLKAVEELKPETVILNGDVLDMFAVSRYPKDLRLSNLTLQEEKNHFHSFLQDLNSISENFKKFQIFETNSNHSGNGLEGRWWRYLSDRLGELSSLNNLEEKLSYQSVFYPENCPISLVDYVEVVDGFVVMHGDVCRKQSGYSARGMFEKWFISIVCNHTHRIGMTAQRFPSIGNTKEKIVRVFENGCACDLKPSYSSVTNWQNSFIVIDYSDDTKNPAVEQVLVHNGEATVGVLGKTLKA